MKELLLEILKFFKNNLIKIILGTVGLAIIFVLVLTLTSSDETDSLDEEAVEVETIETEAQPANFKFFVEYQDGDIYSNNLLIEEYTLNPDILDAASDETNTNLAEIIERTENKIIFDVDNSKVSQIIGVTRDGNTHLQEFYVNVGNESDNLTISEYFYDFYLNQLPILQDKNVYIFQEPQILNLDEEEVLETTIDVDGQDPFGNRILIGLFLGFVVSTGILVAISFFSKKINYSYSYVMRENDNFILVDKKINYKNDLVELLSNSDGDTKVLSEHQDGLSSELIDDLVKENSLERFNSLFELRETETIERLIYIIEEGYTTREWYNKQRSYDKNYNLPTMIIQINK